LQIFFQPANPIWMAFCLIACASLFASCPAAAANTATYASAWLSGPKSASRLIAAGGQQQGFYRAGIEIRLDPFALTYWRSPGGAGVPPVFSFETSDNAADIAVFFPVPTRIEEEGTDVLGYQGHVIFPLHVTPQDASRPVRIAAKLSYAVCDRICLPARAEIELTLSPDAKPDAKEAELIATAEAAVPWRLKPAERDAKLRIEPDPKAAVRSWQLFWDGALQDLFVEAPPGWYFETRKLTAPGAFQIVQVESPHEGSQDPVPLTLTLKGEEKSYEFPLDLHGVP